MAFNEFVEHIDVALTLTAGVPANYLSTRTRPVVDPYRSLVYLCVRSYTWQRAEHLLGDCVDFNEHILSNNVFRL